MPAELAFADFVNGVYRLNGANVAVSAILVENTEWGTFNPATEINPAHGLGTVGSATPTVAPGLTATLLPTGFTLVGSVKAKPGGIGSLTINLFDLPDWTTDWISNLQADNQAVKNTFTYLSANTDTFEVAPLIGVGPFKYAMTFVSGHISLSINGGAVQTLATAMPWTILNTIGINSNSLEMVPTMIFHPPQPDAALLELSAFPPVVIESPPTAPGGPSRAAQRRLKQAIENRSRFEAERARRLANLTNDRPLFVTPPETLEIINEVLVEDIDHSVLFENEDQDEELLLLLMMV